MTLNYTSHVKITIIDGAPIEAPEFRRIYLLRGWRSRWWLRQRSWRWRLSGVDEEVDDREGEDVVFNCIRQALSSHLSVIKSAFSQSEEKDDRKRTAIFHTFIKIGDKNYKVIANRGSWINAVSSEVIESDGLKLVPHSHPYKVPWTNSQVLGVKHLCLIPINFHLYF